MKEFEMVTCYYCKTKNTTVAHVKACASLKETVAVVNAKKTLPSLEEVLGDDVNPDPKAELDKWQAAEQAKIAQYNADLAKVEIGVILDETPAPVKEKFIPAHRKAKMQLAAAQAAATTGTWTGSGISHEPITAAVPLITPEQVESIAASINAASAAAGIMAQAKADVLAILKTGQDLELGMYQVKGEDGTVTIYKVKFNKAGTYKFAEKLVISQKSFFNKETSTWDVKPSGKFWYAQSMMNKLTSEHKMSEADAKAFHDMTKAKYGVDYGFCCVCGKLLTVKKSIDAGIGPVCGKSF